MFDKVEPTATIICHALNLKFEVLNQTRSELLAIRDAIQAGTTGTIMILLPGNMKL